MSYFEIKGVIPPMITPFKENGEVDYMAFENNIKSWNNYELAGYLVLGSNSETSYLDEDEKLKLIEITLKNKKENSLVMVGTGMESTNATISLTNKAAKLGADCSLILTPHYYGNKMNDDALISYFNEVANNSKIPILIYNVTNYTHINVSLRVVSELAKHKNIIGMKDSTGNISQLTEFLIATEKEDFNVIVGTASAWYPALCIGVKAAVLALANSNIEECIKIQALYENNRLNEALELYKRMLPVNKAITATYGIAGLKYLCTKLGLQGGFVRKPLLELTEADKIKIDKIALESQIVI